MTTLDEDTEDGGVVVETLVKQRGKKKKDPDDKGAPVENEGVLPLFPDIDKHSRNVVFAIEVIKTTPPNDGYKGQVPPTANKQHIGIRYGNGLYTFEAVNADGEMLRRVQNVKIDFTPAPESVGSSSPRAAPAQPYDGSLAERLLGRLSEEHEKSSQRSKELTEQTIKATTEQAKSYAELIREDSKTRGERDRQFFEAQTKQQQNFFAEIMTNQQQMHEHNMASMREGFQQTMQMMELNHRHAQAMSNPMLLLQLFKQGLEFGNEMSGEGDPFTTVVNAGVKGLSEFRQMMSLQSGKSPAKLPNGQSASKGAEKGKKPGKAGLSRLSRDEAVRVMRIKKLAERAGQDFDAMLSQAESVLAGAGDDDSDDEPGDTDPSKPAGSADVGST